MKALLNGEQYKLYGEKYFANAGMCGVAMVLARKEGTANILGLEVLRLIHKYNVHHTFAKRMREEINALPEQWQKQKSLIEQRIGQLDGIVSVLARESKDIQTFHCKRVACLMTKIYENVIALKDAVIGGERKQIIADIYLRNTWEDKEVDLEMLQVRYFDVLMNNESMQVHIN